jgi:hypothetical protein
MTNMKALQMLDHGMLWVARATSFFICLTFLSHVLVAWHDIFWMGIPYNPPFAINAILFGIASAYSLLCLWNPQRMLNRIYLGLFASLFLFGVVYEAGQHSLLSNTPEYFWIHYAPIILGLPSMIWVAIRPHQNSLQPYSFQKSC